MTATFVGAALDLAALAAIGAVRAVWTLRAAGRPVAARPAAFLDTVLLLCFAAGLAVPLALYLATDALRFADYRLPLAAVLFGTAPLAASVALFFASHAALGSLFSTQVLLREGHRLVTHGVYTRMRHPLYAGAWLLLLTQPLLLHNFLAGLAPAVCFAPLYFLRVRSEEKLLRANFPAEYDAWAAFTRRLLPFRRSRR